MNSPHQMEPFNTNINCFGGLYRCQWHFLSLPLESGGLSLFRNWKITKIKFCTKLNLKNIKVPKLCNLCYFLSLGTKIYLLLKLMTCYLCLVSFSF
jgi:hypothetical protein